MTLNVMQANITFASALRDRQATTRIVIHHTDSAPDTTVEQIHQWHLNKGWAGIGYHYVIRGDGGIWQGRPEGKQGAHAYDSATRQANTDGIGITVCGRLEQNAPTPAQMDSLTTLIKDIKGRYGELAVVKHSDVCATSCPGVMFPWADLLARLAGNVPAPVTRTKADIMAEGLAAGIISSADHNPDDPTPKWMAVQIGLNIKGGK